MIAIEESTAAVRDAAINTLGLENVVLVGKKTEEALDTLDEEPDAVILTRLGPDATRRCWKPSSGEGRRESYTSPAIRRPWAGTLISWSEEDSASPR